MVIIAILLLIQVATSLYSIQTSCAEKERQPSASDIVPPTVTCVLRLKESPGKQQQAAKLPEHLKELYRASADGLTPNQQTQVYNLLCELADVFSQGPHDLGRTDLVQHRINTRDASPIRQPPRRLPLTKQQDAAKAVEDMEKEGVIETSCSPWAFGLCNAPATFERLMEKVLAGLPLTVCLILMISWFQAVHLNEEHIKNLRVVLLRLREAKLKLSPKKCILFQRQVKFLGHIK